MKETILNSFNQLGIRSRLREKKLYLVLLKDCGVVIPPQQNSNTGNIRGVVAGIKKSDYLSCYLTLS